MTVYLNGVDVSTGALVYTPLIGTDNHPHPGGAGTWQDWDISAIVPVGTRYVEVSIGSNNSALTINAGVRANGSGLARFNTIAITAVGATGNWSMSVTTDMDAARIIEIYADTVNFGTVNFCVLGYWS